MSNIGRPTCQLWFEKNHPEKALPSNDIRNESVDWICRKQEKACLKEANVKLKNSANVGLKFLKQ